ncbi:MAG: ComEC/Rec2 family competence protein [Treponema sp.]|jgi:competence protein ComEC|nr:ComEC/Rec2 family competence protein [Treponema sp.]
MAFMKSAPERLSPIVCVALGAAVSFYGLGFLRQSAFPWVFAVWIVIVFLLGILGSVRALATLSFLYAPRNRYRLKMLGIQVTAFVLGFSMGLACRGSITGNIRLGMRFELVTGLIGVLETDPRLAGGGGMAYLKLETAAGRDGLRCSARGTMPVFFPKGSTPRLKSFGRGSRVYIEGVPVQSRRDSRRETDFLFRAVSVHILEAASPVERFRTRLRLSILEKLSPPLWGGLAQALILGARDNLDTGLAQAYRDAGCSHVLALSGLHLAVIASIIAFFLKKPLGLKPAAAVGAVFIILYTGLVGTQPSLERAAIMYLLGTLTIFCALPKTPLPLLALTFLIQIVGWPESADSLSFILSYLALGGILTLGEAIYDLLRGKLPDFFARPLAASIGAFTATAAVVSSSFGALHPAGILGGLIIVPLTTVFMIVAMIWLTIRLLIPPLTGPVGIALTFLYTLLSRLTYAVSWAPALNTAPRMAASPAAVLGVTLGFSVIIAAVWSRRCLMRNRLDPFDKGY